MTNLVYLSLIPPILLGFLLVVWLTLKTERSNLLFIFSLGIPVGFGIDACLYSLWSYLLNPSFPGFWLVEALLIAVLVFLNWKQRDQFKTLIPDWKKWTWLDWGLAAFFLVVLIIGLVSFDAYTKANPHGRYDAWAIWNVRARMIARGGEHWKSVFIPQVFHADYPLLVPLTIARAWVLAGTESQKIPPAVAGLFTFASAGILPGALLSLRKKQSAWLAGIILLTTPWFVYFGSLQFADLPLAACILSAVSCLCMALMDRLSSLRWFALAALAAGLAAWVKNEGQLFLLVFAVVAAAVFLFSFQKNERLQVLLHAFYGLILPLTILVLFKLTLAPANDVVDTGNLGQSVSQLLSPSRYGEVITAYLHYPKGFGGWALPLPLAFLSFWILMGPKVNKENRAAVFSLAGVLALQWIGYFLIFVITPHALQTHINQSYDRLLMHIYPSFLLFLFLFLPPLDTIAFPWQKSKNTPAV
jgi:hypothetical protein